MTGPCSGVGDVEVGQGVAVLADEHAGTAAGQHGHHGRLHLLDDGLTRSSSIFRMRVSSIGGANGQGSEKQSGQQPRQQPRSTII